MKTHRRVLPTVFFNSGDKMSPCLDNIVFLFLFIFLFPDLSYPAHNSAFKGDLAYLQMVIETGVASVNERDERNSTPLHKGI